MPVLCLGAQLVVLQVEAGPVDAEEYAVYRSLTDLREPYRWGRSF